MNTKNFISALAKATLNYEPQSCGKQKCGNRHTGQTKVE